VGVPGFERWLLASRPHGRGGGGRRHQRWRRFGSWSARAWMQDRDGTPLVDHVLRLEHLEQELPALWRTLGMAPPASLPWCNSRPEVDWRRWYKPSSRTLVASRYAWELDHFYPGDVS
jgi:hypothetical protein